MSTFLCSFLWPTAQLVAGSPVSVAVALPGFLAIGTDAGLIFLMHKRRTRRRTRGEESSSLFSSSCGSLDSTTTAGTQDSTSTSTSTSTTSVFMDLSSSSTGLKPLVSLSNGHLLDSSSAAGNSPTTLSTRLPPLFNNKASLRLNNDHQPVVGRYSVSPSGFDSPFGWFAPYLLLTPLWNTPPPVVELLFIPVPTTCSSSCSFFLSSSSFLLLVSLHSDSSLRVYALDDGRCLQAAHLVQHAGFVVHALRLVADPRFVVLCGEYQAALWDLWAKDKAASPGTAVVARLRLRPGIINTQRFCSIATIEPLGSREGHTPSWAAALLESGEVAVWDLHSVLDNRSRTMPLPGDTRSTTSMWTKTERATKTGKIQENQLDDKDQIVILPIFVSSAVVHNPSLEVGSGGVATQLAMCEDLVALVADSRIVLWRFAQEAAELVSAPLHPFRDLFCPLSEALPDGTDPIWVCLRLSPASASASRGDSSAPNATDAMKRRRSHDACKVDLFALTSRGTLFRYRLSASFCVEPLMTLDPGWLGGGCVPVPLICPTYRGGTAGNFVVVAVQADRVVIVSGTGRAWRAPPPVRLLEASAEMQKSIELACCMEDPRQMTMKRAGMPGDTAASINGDFIKMGKISSSELCSGCSHLPSSLISTSTSFTSNLTSGRSAYAGNSALLPPPLSSLTSSLLLCPLPSSSPPFALTWTLGEAADGRVFIVGGFSSGRVAAFCLNSTAVDLWRRGVAARADPRRICHAGLKYPKDVSSRSPELVFPARDFSIDFNRFQGTGATFPHFAVAHLPLPPCVTSRLFTCLKWLGVRTLLGATTGGDIVVWRVPQFSFAGAVARALIGPAVVAWRVPPLRGLDQVEGEETELADGAGCEAYAAGDPNACEIGAVMDRTQQLVVVICDGKGEERRAVGEESDAGRRRMRQRRRTVPWRVNWSEKDEEDTQRDNQINVSESPACTEPGKLQKSPSDSGDDDIGFSLYYLERQPELWFTDIKKIGIRGHTLGVATSMYIFYFDIISGNCLQKLENQCVAQFQFFLNTFHLDAALSPLPFVPEPPAYHPAPGLPTEGLLGIGGTPFSASVGVASSASSSLIYPLRMSSSRASSSMRSRSEYGGGGPLRAVANGAIWLGETPFRAKVGSIEYLSFTTLIVLNLRRLLERFPMPEQERSVPKGPPDKLQNQNILQAPLPHPTSSVSASTSMRQITLPVVTRRMSPRGVKSDSPLDTTASFLLSSLSRIYPLLSFFFPFQVSHTLDSFCTRYPFLTPCPLPFTTAVLSPFHFVAVPLPVAPGRRVARVGSMRPLPSGPAMARSRSPGCALGQSQSRLLVEGSAGRRISHVTSVLPRLQPEQVSGGEEVLMLDLSPLGRQRGMPRTALPGFLSALCESREGEEEERLHIYSTRCPVHTKSTAMTPYPLRVYPASSGWFFWPSPFNASMTLLSWQLLLDAFDTARDRPPSSLSPADLFVYSLLGIPCKPCPLVLALFALHPSCSRTRTAALRVLTRLLAVAPESALRVMVRSCGRALHARPWGGFAGGGRKNAVSGRDSSKKLQGKDVTCTATPENEDEVELDEVTLLLLTMVLYEAQPRFPCSTWELRELLDMTCRRLFVLMCELPPHLYKTGLFCHIFSLGFATLWKPAIFKSKQFFAVLGAESADLDPDGLLSYVDDRFAGEHELFLLVWKLHSVAQCTALAPTCESCLLQAGRQEPEVLIQAMAVAARRLPKGNSYINSAIIILMKFFRRFRERAADFLPEIVGAVVRCLDPADPLLRRSTVSSSTNVLFELVKAYPMATFHQRSQRLAVGAQAGSIVLYDLRTATRFKILQGHLGRVSAVAFSPEGDQLASYSIVDASFRLWQCSSPGFFSGLLRSSDTCIKVVNMPFVAPRSTSFRHLLEIVKLQFKSKSEWILRREDGLVHSISI